MKTASLVAGASAEPCRDSGARRRRRSRRETQTLLLIAIADRLPPALRDELSAVVAEAEHDERLAAELANLRAQLAALWSIASPASGPLVTARA
jgi:hypothetical protein